MKDNSVSSNGFPGRFAGAVPVVTNSTPSPATETVPRPSPRQRLLAALAGLLPRNLPASNPPSGRTNSSSSYKGASRALGVTALLALLAASLLFLLPGGPLHAQEGGVSGSGAGCEETSDKMGYECDYAENGTGPVATFTATDPEGAVVAWSLGTTANDQDAIFSISKEGVLTFRESPDYETPATDVTDNMYMVTVLATDDAYDIAVPSNGEALGQTTKTVTVEVTNEEEPGKVTLTVTTDISETATQVPVLQPQMGETLTAMLSDGDTLTATTITWQWYRGSTEIIGATDTDATSTYIPVQADIGEKLTAKATYTDGKNPNDKDMAEATTIMEVRAAPSTNNAPAFPDEDPSTPEVDKTPKRKVAENTPAGRNIGAPVKANDQGDVLAYSLAGAPDEAPLFDIDIATGQLKTKGKLNREALAIRGATTPYTVVVMVTAVDPFGQSDTATVTIEIENEDESPTIDERTAKAMLRYAEPVGATVTAPVLLWPYAAMDDEDAAASVGLKWKLEGRDRSKLTIGNADVDRGELKFLKNPDFEKPADANKNNVYEVTVVVTDSGDLTDTLAVRVEVTNAKEDGEVTFTVGTPRVEVPLTAMLADLDGGETGHEWQWMVAETSEEDAVKTDIDGATSATFTPRDRDLAKFLSVKVKYTDGKGKDEVTEVLTTAVAESAAPRFYKTRSKTEVVTKFELEFPENTAADMDAAREGEIFVDHRTDAELLTYAVGGADASSFKVIPEGSIAADAMVKLQAQGPLDIEDKASYAVTVTATDSDGNSATLPVTVTVTPIDEMPMVSGSGAGCEEKADKTGYVCEYAENDTGPVATFTAADPEGAVVAWSLDTIANNQDAIFSISKEGVLTFRESPDYETPATDVTDNMYMVTVLATDDAYDIAVPSNGEALGQTTKTVTVEVTNEEEPGKVTLAVTTDISETATQVPVLQMQMEVELTATLSDGDTPTPTTITWQWYRGSTEIIGATDTGATSTYTPVESDIGSRLTAKVTYMDGEDANNKKMAQGSTTRSVRRAPSTNIAPTFPDEDPSTSEVDKTPKRKVAENTPAGRNIGAPVKANDQGDVLAYSLAGAPDEAPLFDIDIATGQLKTKGKLNREALAIREATTPYTVVVMVTAVDPFGQSDTATVTIEIENEDESPTIDERTAKAMLRYAEPVGATVTAPVLLWPYAAMDDEDAAASVGLKWKLEGRDRSKLTIGNADVDRGELKFLKNPDFEKPADANKNNVYEVTVVVTDSGDLTDTLAVRVEVTNAKEDGEVTFTVGTPRVEVPLTAMLADLDGGETGHEWQWMVAETSEEDAVKTDIDGATSATFTPRDRDLAKFLSVKVKYTDGKGKDEVTEVLTTAVAESAAPRFYKTRSKTEVVTKFELEFPENTAADMDAAREGEIFVDHRTDAELLTYAVGGADASSFKVIPEGSIAADAMVKLQAQGPLDIEDKASYAVTVTATDSDGNSATLSVTVMVTPVDEMPVVMLGALTNQAPTFPGAATARSVGENTLAGTNIGAPVAATDADNDALTYALSGNDAASFDIVRTTGQLQTKAALDHETKNRYSVIVSVRDSKDADGNPDTATDDTIRATITVTNVNEAPVVPTVANQTATKDTAFSYTVPAFTDPEGGTITYTATLSDDSALPGWLSFNASTRELSGTPLEADTPASPTIKVSVTDDGSPSASAQVTFTLTVGEEAPTTLLARYDADDSGKIEQSEVIEAINDYLFGVGTDAISKDDAIEVIKLYLFD